MLVVNLRLRRSSSNRKTPGSSLGIHQTKRKGREGGCAVSATDHHGLEDPINIATPAIKATAPATGGTSIVCVFSAVTCSGPASITVSRVRYLTTPSYENKIMPTMTKTTAMERPFMIVPLSCV